jgi:hypothetical protein
MLTGQMCSFFLQLVLVEAFFSPQRKYIPSCIALMGTIRESRGWSLAVTLRKETQRFSKKAPSCSGRPVFPTSQGEETKALPSPPSPSPRGTPPSHTPALTSVCPVLVNLCPLPQVIPQNPPGAENSPQPAGRCKPPVLNRTFTDRVP